MAYLVLELLHRMEFVVHYIQIYLKVPNNVELKALQVIDICPTKTPFRKAKIVTTSSGTVQIVYCQIYLTDMIRVH